ncbi:MAG: hypothetical protein R3F08_14805 [Dokdonella sp.]
MELERTFEESNLFAEQLLELINVPPIDDSPRIKVARISCSLALEHWHAVRLLMEVGLLPAAVIVHRAQFDAIVRSIWLTHCASDSDIAKLTAQLDSDSEQAAKNMATTNQMMVAIAKSAPVEAHAALARFKGNSWKALNSFVHTGLHAIKRHEAGYPAGLIHVALCNANGIAVVCGMQAVALGGRQPLQKKVVELSIEHSSCMPPPL